MDYQSELTKKEHNKKYYKSHKPYPVRLGELKPLIMQDAFDTDQSGHYIIKKIIEAHYAKEGRLTA